MARIASTVINSTKVKPPRFMNSLVIGRYDACLKCEVLATAGQFSHCFHPSGAPVGEAFGRATRRITGMGLRMLDGGSLFRASLVGLSLGLSGAAAAAPSVALLPVVNVAGENWEQLKARQSNVCNSYLRDQFTSRGFKISPADAVLKEMKTEGIDFSDDEQQRRAILFQLGHALRVDFIVLAVITDTRASTNSH